MKRNFGYGMPNAQLLPDTPKPLPADVHEFRKKISRAYCWLIAYSIAVALLLPSHSLQTELLEAWVRLVQQVMPYVAWVERNSKIPQLATAWFALVWPLLPAYVLYVLVVFPYRSVGSMLQANPIPSWKHLLLTLSTLAISVMSLGLFFDRRFAVAKTTVGHGRLVEAVVMDSRVGLALGAPVLASVCLIVWGGTAVIAVLFLGRHLHISKS